MANFNFNKEAEVYLCSSISDVEEGLQVSQTLAPFAETVNDGVWAHTPVISSWPRTHIVTVYIALTSDTTYPSSSPYGEITYTFSNKSITGGTLNGWTTEIPILEPGEYLWIKRAIATEDIDSGTGNPNDTTTLIFSAAGTSSDVVFAYKRVPSTLPPADHLEWWDRPPYGRTYNFSSGLWTGGSEVDALSFIVGDKYIISSVGDGSTDWNTIAETTGVVYEQGSPITVKAAGTGNGKAHRVLINFDGSAGVFAQDEWKATIADTADAISVGGEGKLYVSTAIASAWPLGQYPYKDWVTATKTKIGTADNTVTPPIEQPVPGQRYKIFEVGTTNWAQIGVPAGVAIEVGTEFVANSVAATSTESATETAGSAFKNDSNFWSEPQVYSASDKKVLMAGEVVLPSTFTNTEETLFEIGGLGAGTWIGMTNITGVGRCFQFRSGGGSAASQITDAVTIVFSQLISDIEEFDGKIHTVAWEIDPPNFTVKLWIDNKLLFRGTTINPAFFVWTGSSSGSWGKGYGQAAGSNTPSTRLTPWSGAVVSDLRIYTDVPMINQNLPILLDVGPDLSFTQTFTDKTYQQKTLHEQHKMHEASNIKKANPANFDMTVHMITQDSLATVLDLLVDYKTDTYTLNTFDLYVKLPNDVYKLETCVITNGTFIIEKLQNLKLSLSGQAAKLTRGREILFPLPTRGTRTYQMTKSLGITINGAALSSCLYKCSIELQNDIKWIPYETVNAALDVTNASNSMYPSQFTLEKRILSGSIGQYVTDTSNTDVQTWDTNVPLVITAGNGLSSTSFRGFKFNLANCSFTNRNSVGDVYTQAYDWKMNDNPTDLGSKITLN